MNGLISMEWGRCAQHKLLLARALVLVVAQRPEQIVMVVLLVLLVLLSLSQTRTTVSAIQNSRGMSITGTFDEVDELLASHIHIVNRLHSNSSGLRQR
jgi:hypothetical protein